MSNTLWINKKPGDLAASVQVDEVVAWNGEEGAVVVLYDKPDWVRHPITGAKLRCLDKARQLFACPKCNEEHVGTLTICEDRLCVFDCPKCQEFIWFQVK